MPKVWSGIREAQAQDFDHSSNAASSGLDSVKRHHKLQELAQRSPSSFTATPFGAVYRSRHFGGKIWGWLFISLDKLSDGHWLGTLIAFLIRFIAAAAIGMFDGAIYRTYQAVKLIKLRKSYATAVQAAY